jgi:hypothetical protein
MSKNNFFKNLLIKTQKKCPCCNQDNKQSNSTNVIDLPKYPITEFYRNQRSKLISDALINQKVLFCKTCDHMYLQNILDVNKIYRNYITSTNSSGGAVLCLKNFYSFIYKKNKNIDRYNLVDIGGNDSTFLKLFRKNKKLKINIDPNASSSKKNIILKKVFLENINFNQIAQSKNKTAYLSSHTIEHLENPILLLKNLSEVLKKDDVIYLQFPSLEKLVEHMRFDQICHQHINYFSLKSISKVLLKLKLYINDYEFDTSHFGTLRIKISRSNINNKKLIFSKKMYINLKNSYNNFSKYYAQLNYTLKNYFKNGQGYGAGLMVPILAYYLPLINNLDVIIDENPEKLNKKFINLKPIIKNKLAINKNKPMLVTSISTKAAGRQIFNKLSKHGIDDICIPSIVI